MSEDELVTQDDDQIGREKQCLDDAFAVLMDWASSRYREPDETIQRLALRAANALNAICANLRKRELAEIGRELAPKPKASPKAEIA